MGKNHQVQRNPTFRFEIDNFSKKEAVIVSQRFVSSGCEWNLYLHPKGDSLCDDQLSLYLYAANPGSLGRRWKRNTIFEFFLLNQSDEELYRSPIAQHIEFCAKRPAWGFRKTLPLTKLQEKGFLENDRLIVEVYISRVEVVDGEGGVESEKKETVDINGFQVLASHVTSARKIFVEHPDIAEDFKPKNQVVKTEYMNVLLNLVERLSKLSQNHSETELSNAHSELSELMEQGFKLDWLKTKLDEVFLERKKSDDADGSQGQEMEGSIKNIEMMVSDAKGRIMNLEMTVSDLKGRIMNLEMMVSDLKGELDEEAKSSADGF